jgi:hypothetical protein
VAAGRGKEKSRLATTEYLARNLRMKVLYDLPKNAGLNLISLQYLKEEWIKTANSERAEPTGKLVLDGWKRTEGQVDINLELTAIVKGGKNLTETRVISNRFDRDQKGLTLIDTTWDELIAVLYGE